MRANLDNWKMKVKKFFCTTGGWIGVMCLCVLPLAGPVPLLNFFLWVCTLCAPPSTFLDPPLNMHTVTLQVEGRQSSTSISTVHLPWHYPFCMFVTELRRHSGGTNWSQLSTKVCRESLDYVIGKACAFTLITNWYSVCTTNYWLPTVWVHNLTGMTGDILVMHCEYWNAFSI